MSFWRDFELLIYLNYSVSFETNGNQKVQGPGNGDQKEQGPGNKLSSSIFTQVIWVLALSWRNTIPLRFVKIVLFFFESSSIFLAIDVSSNSCISWQQLKVDGL